jgi:hypothetical protein
MQSSLYPIEPKQYVAIEICLNKLDLYTAIQRGDKIFKEWSKAFKFSNDMLKEKT